jgi:hypothetical protein
VTETQTDAFARARELTEKLCDLLNEFNGPGVRASVTVTNDSIPQALVYLSGHLGIPMIRAHWCDGSWKVSH